ncbi:MAG: CNNM domain-containing protein [Phycisphaerales bacterium]|jgi:CBS domain containing-hemolysin-like protein
MSGGEALLWTAVALFGLLGSALASGLEMGVYALRRLGLETRALRGEPNAVMLREEIGRTDRLLSTLLVHNNVCNYIGVLGVSALLGALNLGPITVLIVQSAVVTPIILIFGESLPKELFRSGADRLTYAFAPILKALRTFYVLTGSVPLVILASRGLSKVIGGSGLGGSSDARQRMANILKEAGGPSGMTDAHSSLLDGAMALGRGRVGEEMLSWSMAQKVRRDWPADRIVRALGRTPATTVPVIDRHGRVLGMAWSVALLAREAIDESALVPAVLVSPDTPSVVAIRRILAAETDLAIVMQNERPVGIVSLNDLTEPMFEG